MNNERIRFSCLILSYSLRKQQVRRISNCARKLRCSKVANERTSLADSEGTTTIAGFSGYKEISPDDDGKYYNLSVEFLGNDAIYSIYMEADAGNLTKEDITVFEQFIKSIKAK